MRARFALCLGMLGFVAGCGGGGSNGNASGGGGSSGAGGGGSGGTAGTGASAGTGGAGGSGCVDGDGDGHTSTTCGGDDCDDADAERFPGAKEVVVEGGSIPVDPALGKSSLSDIALGPGGAIHVLYGVPGGIGLSIWDKDTWKHETPITGSCNARLAVDAQGKDHILCRVGTPNAGELFYTTNATGSWVTTQLTELAKGDASVGYGADIATDGSSGVHVVYSAAGTWHAVVSGGAPQKSLISSIGSSFQLATDTNGVVHLARSGGGVQLSKLSSGTWTAGPSSTAVTSFDAFAVDAAAGFHLVGKVGQAYAYAISGPSGLADDSLPLPLHKDPQLRLAPDGSIHLFATRTISSYHTVGSTHAYRASDGWRQQPLHETMSWIQEPLGLVMIDGQGRLHRIEPAGRHTYWDAADSDCDGLGW